MSNHLAIATVTAWLKQTIQEAVHSAVPQATVIVGPPRPSPTGPEASLRLFRVEPNASFRNDNLPSRNSDGSIVQRRQVALDLHYLISFSGEEQDFSTDRMVGKVVDALHTQPVLTREQIRRITDPNGPFPELAKSDLAEQAELVRLAPVVLNLEELSRLWTVFFQATHRVSLTYVASAVLIGDDVPPQ